MSKLYVFLLVLLVLAAASCKKDKATPPVPVVVVNINDVIETKPPIQKPYIITVDSFIRGFYAAVPYNYALTTKNYPLLIFIPGGGQYGSSPNDLPLLLNDGFAQLLDAGTFPPSFTVNGKNFSFIVLTPQFPAYPSTVTVQDFIAYARKNYRIDTSRIYISGLSIGGEVSGDVAGDYPTEIAAIVPLSGESRSMETCASLAHNNIPVWDFHNSGDPVIGISESMDFIAWINSYNPPVPPRQTIFQSSSHDAWTEAINPTYKENNMNIYEWMLQYTR